MTSVRPAENPSTDLAHLPTACLLANYLRDSRDLVDALAPFVQIRRVRTTGPGEVPVRAIKEVLESVHCDSDGVLHINGFSHIMLSDLPNWWGRPCEEPCERRAPMDVLFVDVAAPVVASLISGGLEARAILLDALLRIYSSRPIPAIA